MKSQRLPPRRTSSCPEVTNAPRFTGNMAFAMFFKMYGINVEADPLIAASFDPDERAWIAGGALDWVPPLLSDAYNEPKTGIQTMTRSNTARRAVSMEYNNRPAMGFRGANRDLPRER